MNDKQQIMLHMLSAIKTLKKRSHEGEVEVRVVSVKGDPGPQGIQGECGACGERGLAGANGPRGAAGLQGLQGLAGAEGKRGLRGLTGKDGADGISINLKWRGVFAIGESYSAGDIVQLDPGTWLCVKDTTLSPTVGSESWIQVSKDGRNGSNGAAGAAGVGVPTGGDAGQVLAKIDGTNYNTHWVDDAQGAVTSIAAGNAPIVVDTPTGDVTISYSLSLQSSVTPAVNDYLQIADTSNLNQPKKSLIGSVLDLISGDVTVDSSGVSTYSIVATEKGGTNKNNSTATDGQILIAEELEGGVKQFVAASLSVGTGLETVEGPASLTLNLVATVPVSQNVQVFTPMSPSMIWTKPANAVGTATIYLRGGGGGGGGGASSAANAGAGAGGSGGGGYMWSIDIDQLPATMTFVVGAGGTGGAARSTTGNGNAGSNGVSSTLTWANGLLDTATAGLGGGGGLTTGASAGGTGPSINGLRVGAGGAGSATGNGIAGTRGGRWSASGGSGGGGATITSTTSSGSSGGLGYTMDTGTVGGGGTAGSGTGNGGDGVSVYTRAGGSGGGGGGGVGGLGAGTAGSGGDGVNGGGGGGGGGRSVAGGNGTSGAGGDGASGLAVVICNIGAG